MTVQQYEALSKASADQIKEERDSSGPIADKWWWDLIQMQEEGELYKKLKVDSDENRYVAYAALISNNDLDFLATLEKENGEWTPDRKHDKSYYREGKEILGRWMPAGWYNDWGFCGTSDYYHWDIREDEKFKDPLWQLDQCWSMYKSGVTFYGADARNSVKSHFVLQ